MKDKILIYTAIMLMGGLFFLDILCPDRLFSENENRILQQKPKLFREEASFSDNLQNKLLSGAYITDYEAYVTDQFAGRDLWIGIKTASERAAGQRLINDVYIGEENRLFQQHLSVWSGGDGALEQRALEKLPELMEDAQRYQEICTDGKIKILLVPSSGALSPQFLPPHAAAGAFSEREVLQQGESLAEQQFPGMQVWVDGFQSLKPYEEEYIYYKTDHHWTTLGAYYGYTAWAQSMGIIPYSLESFERETVSEHFAGTLQSRLGLPWETDQIELFLPLMPKKYQVDYDLGTQETDTLYAPKHLETKNQYGIFLDDNHGLIIIHTEGADCPERSILVVKDSYANCFVPFLTEHYGTVYMVDKRYFRSDIVRFLENDQINDVLVLYEVIGFLENY